VALLVPPWDSGAWDASGSWDSAATPTPGLPAGSGSLDPGPFGEVSFISIETSVVIAHPKLLTCLGDDNRVGQPP
jgi:hypothetical protein